MVLNVLLNDPHDANWRHYSQRVNMNLVTSLLWILNLMLYVLLKLNHSKRYKSFSHMACFNKHSGTEPFN